MKLSDYLSLYTVANLFTQVAERVSALVHRRPYNPIEANARGWVYARAQESFDYLTPTSDMVNRAPPKEGEPLMYVEPKDHAELARLGATERNGKWYMPVKISNEDRWVFVNWFARATPDLATNALDNAFTVDGRSTNGYQEPSDIYEGSDSSATGIVMGVLAVLPAAMFVVYQIPWLGPLVALGLGLPLMALHAYTVYQAEDALTLFKVLALSLGLPLLGGAFSGSQFTPQGAILPIGVLSVLAFLLAFVGSGATSGKTETPLVTKFNRFLHALGMVFVLVAVNFALSLLPPSLDAFKTLGLFLPACAYPFYYMKSNERARTATLLLQSLYKAGPTHGGGSDTGKLAPARLEQIREAARDTTPIIPLAIAQGVTGKMDLPSAPDEGQVMGLSMLDFSMHLMVWGRSGKGKTSSFLRPVALRMKMLPEQIGAILSDGKGSMVEDMRDFLDIVIEPGLKFAPFQGMDPETVAEAFNEATDDGIKGEAIWTDGADNFHLFALTILHALVEHEKAGKVEKDLQVKSYELQIDYLLCQQEENRRLKLDNRLVEEQLRAIETAADSSKTFIASTRQFKWTPACYSNIANILATPQIMRGGLGRPNQDALDLFLFLGARPMELPGQEPAEFEAEKKKYDERKLLEPTTIHSAFLEQGRVLARAVDYFTRTWPNTDDKQRSSFMINVNRDILSFLKSDKLRGGMIDGVDHGETAWADTEEGVDVLRVLYGEWLGINLPTTQFKKSGKIIAKLVKTKIFKAIKIRSEKYGSDWAKATGQCSVMDMVDECQFMVSPLEADLTSMARSMGLFFVYATQKIEGLVKLMKSEEATINFLEDFASQVAFDTSAATLEYLKQRAGEAKRLMVQAPPQAIMDVKRAILTQENTIYHDPNHAGAKMLRDLDRRGGARMQVVVEGMTPYRGLTRRVPLSEQRDQTYIPVHMSGTLEVGPILETWQMTDKLSVRGSVLCMLNRAGHARIDFATVESMSVQHVKDTLAAHRKSLSP